MDIKGERMYTKESVKKRETPSHSQLPSYPYKKEEKRVEISKK